MKMLLAIVNYDDSRNVMSHLMKAGFSITKLASTGGFLRSGNVAILIGLEDHQVDDAFEIIRTYSTSRRQIVPMTTDLGLGAAPLMPMEVSVGGATVFVLGVERFEKI